MLIGPGTAFKAILTEINGARIYVAAMCNGMMRSTISIAYGAQRQSFGKPLNAIESWQADLTTAKGALDVSEALTAVAVELVKVEAKIAAVSCAQTHLPALLHLMGAEGLRAEHPFTRHIAAAQIAEFADGTTNILKQRVA